MAVTVASVVSNAQIAFPDLSQAVALSILNDAFNEISQDVVMVEDTSLQITLTANTYLYTFDDTTMKVWEANYQTAAATWVSLTPTSVDQLDARFQGWRTQTAAAPTMFFQQGGYIGFYPTPPTSTASGYPVVNCYVSQQPTTLLISSSLPSPVRIGDAFLYSILYRYSLLMHPDQAEGWKSLKTEAVMMLKRYMEERVARLKGELPNARAKMPSPVGGS